MKTKPVINRKSDPKPYIMFEPNNAYRFGQDMGFGQNVPSDVKFHPMREVGATIEFIGHGYGASERRGVAGNYGNGAIYVYASDIPHLLDWCRKNYIAP